MQSVKTKMVRIGIVAVGIGLCLAVLSAWLVFHFQPRVTLVNNSAIKITSTQVVLPSNKLEFAPVAPNHHVTIAYSPTQSDGVYQYQVILENGTVIQGSCGYVTSSEYGKTLKLLVSADLLVTCIESF